MIFSLEQKHKVCSYYVDFNQRMTLTALMHLCQEIAGEHAGLNHFGFTDLDDKGLLWVLSRVKLVISMYPIRDENITIKTWAKEPDGLFAYRDFEVLNEQNEVIAVASSAWLILDINSRRPHRLDAFKKDFPIVRENVMASAPEKLPPVEVAQKNGPIRIAVSDIDFNGHTNNASYIRWILDSLPIEWHRENLTKELEVNFLHESTTEQHYIVGKQDMDNDTSLFSISRQEDGKELIRVKLTSTRI